MEASPELVAALDRLAERLDGIETKIDQLANAKRKSLDWIGQLSEHIRSLDEFREEVRVSLEPIFSKLEHVDETMRIMRHATSDVARRIEQIESDDRRLAG